MRNMPCASLFFLLLHVSLPRQDDGRDRKDGGVNERYYYGVSAINEDSMGLPCLVNNVKRGGPDRFSSAICKRTAHNVEVRSQQVGGSA